MKNWTKSEKTEFLEKVEELQQAQEGARFTGASCTLSSLDFLPVPFKVFKIFWIFFSKNVTMKMKLTEKIEGALKQIEKRSIKRIFKNLSFLWLHLL